MVSSGSGLEDNKFTIKEAQLQTGRVEDESCGCLQSRTELMKDFILLLYVNCWNPVILKLDDTRD